MESINIINFKEYGKSKWKGVTNFGFAKKDSFCPIVAQELPHAIMFFPVCFIPVEDTFALAILFGLEPDSNLAVDEEGNWLAGYIPAGYRGYPFLLGENPKGEKVLCALAENEFISENFADGNSFFDEEGRPSESTKELFNFLTQVSANKILTDAACKALQKHGLIQEWPITIQRDNASQQLEGVYRIDESRLKNLTSESLKELCDTGALTVLFAQLFSMSHLARLGDRMKYLHSIENNSCPSELNFDPISNDGTINFNNF